jgi:F0F1-type ATP synthase epsilon subunit
VRIGNDWQKYVINGGFVQVVRDEVLILADDALQAEALVKTEIASAISNAEQKLASKLEPAELIRLEKILRYEKFKSQYVGM